LRFARQIVERDAPLRLVRRNAMLALLKAGPESLQALSAAELEALLDLARHAEPRTTSSLRSARSRLTASRCQIAAGLSICNFCTQWGNFLFDR
jgi:hypothetical protein